MQNELYHFGILGMKWGIRRDRKSKKKEETIEEKKERVLKSRSAAELYANADLFTTQELRSAYDRLNLEHSIKKLIPEQVSKGKKFIDTTNAMSNSLGNVSSMINNGTNLYNNIAKVLNSIDDDANYKLIGDSKKNDTGDSINITETLVEKLTDGTTRTTVKKTSK